MRQGHTSADAATAGWADPATPLAGFSRCHEGILTQIQAFSGLPALVEAAIRARSVAADTVALFENVVLAHHGDEESELFPAVLRWSAKGEEHDRVRPWCRGSLRSTGPSRDSGGSRGPRSRPLPAASLPTWTRTRQCNW